MNVNVTVVDYAVLSKVPRRAQDPQRKRLNTDHHGAYDWGRSRFDRHTVPRLMLSAIRQ